MSNPKKLKTAIEVPAKTAWRLKSLGL